MGYSALPNCEQTFKMKEHIKLQRKLQYDKLKLLTLVKRIKLDQ